MNLILFTSTYPFDGGAEQTFLDAEVEHLIQVFDRVILVPKIIKGRCLPLPERVTVEESYAELLQKAKLLPLISRVLRSGLVYRELLSRPSLLLHLQAIQRMGRFMAVASLTSDWVKAWLDKNKGEAKNIFYTYWFDSSSFGIGLTKQDHPDIRLVSRVHGYDLYEEYYYRPAYWPFRRNALALLDGLFPDSDAGFRYLAQKYPEYLSIYDTRLLGVTKSGFSTSYSQDQVFRIISCSMLVPIKRVELLLEGIIYAACVRPNQKFEWVHMGDGKIRSNLQKYANNQLPSNATAHFAGYSTKSALMNFYHENPVDVFVNVSETEGTPVSIMEAASCSIPVIATFVGGNPEIVSEKNGIVLSSNPTPEEIANALFFFLDNPAMAIKKRKGSYDVWNERYNADVNFRVFAEQLKSIGES